MIQKESSDPVVPRLVILKICAISLAYRGPSQDLVSLSICGLGGLLLLFKLPTWEASISLIFQLPVYILRPAFALTWAVIRPPLQR